MASVATSQTRLLLGVRVLSGVAACDCAAPGDYALQVRVQDERTGANLLPGSTVVARDGAYVDSVTVVTDAAVVGLASERPGTYSLTVRQPEYVETTLTGLRAERGRCIVDARPVVVRLRAVVP